MITELYVFSPGSYVVADEWNANFRVLEKSSLLHRESIIDGYNTIAFPNSDMSDIYIAVKNKPNSSAIPGNTVTVAPEQEYYKILGNSEDLTINIPMGLNAESRILLQIQEDRSLLPIAVNYAGTLIVSHYNDVGYDSGYYYVMIYETNGVAQVKLIWTGV